MELGFMDKDFYHIRMRNVLGFKTNVNVIHEKSTNSQ